VDIVCFCQSKCSKDGQTQQKLLCLILTNVALACFALVPDKEVMQEMRRRESDLTRNKLAQRAYSLLSSDRLAVNREIQLRVVREFGLPDSAVEILQSSVDYTPHRQDMCLPLSGACCLVPHHGRRLFQFPPRAIHRVYNVEERQSPSPSPSLVRSCNHLEVSYGHHYLFQDTYCIILEHLCSTSHSI